jgi:hypothetical protein
MQITSIDPWAQEKAQLEKFWETVFHYEIDWNKFILPEKTERFPHLNILPKEYLPALVYHNINACKSFTFTKRRKGEPIDEVVANAKYLQARPSLDYAWADEGGQTPDAATLGKPYPVFMANGDNFMNLTEYMLSNAEYEFRTSRTYDEEGMTILSMISKYGDAILMGRPNIEWVHMAFMNLDESSRLYGPRKILLGV